MLTHIKAVNQHAVLVAVPGYSPVVLPACNISLEQAGTWDAYFEFGLETTIGGHYTYSHYVFSHHKHGRIEVERFDKGQHKIALTFTNELDFRMWLREKEMYGSTPAGNPGKKFDRYVEA